MIRFLFIALFASLVLSACQQKEEAAAPSASPVNASAPPMTAVSAPNTGKVLQTMQASGYTYAEVDAGNGQKVWIAGATIPVKAGDMVQWGEYAVMNNFTSKTLGRTFDQILFVNVWGPQGGNAAQVAPHGTPPANRSAGAGQAPMEQPTGAATTGGEVKSVSTAAGYTYLEIKRDNAIVWVAAPETAVKAGDKVSWEGGSLMQNFTAKSLGRTFDQIIFVGKVSVVH